MAFYLSKSQYCSALQCPKMLWLKKSDTKQYEKCEQNQAVLDSGKEIGDLAMGLLGEYTEVAYNRDDLSQMVADTEKLLAAGTAVITEASFSYEGLFCSVDILKNLGNGCVEIYEVKSTSNRRKICLDDVYFQYFVLTKLGFDVQRTCIVYLNKDYVRMGDLDIQKLFRREDITEEAAANMEKVEENVSSIKTFLQQVDEPGDHVGARCFLPHECGFFEYCTRNLPKPNVFDVANMNKHTMEMYYRNGVISFEDLSKHEELPAYQKMQVDAELKCSGPQIKDEKIRDFLNGLSYPLYFLDFEAYTPAIPVYDHCGPNTLLPFQYSLHYIEHAGGKLQHKEFLAEPGVDPRRALAEQLCRDIPRGVCILAYHKSYEEGCIKKMADIFEDLKDHLMDMHTHLQDLRDPFKVPKKDKDGSAEKAYYCREMEGSSSIKKVLPALFPGDPSLDYKALEGVHNGLEASTSYQQMHAMSPEAQAELRNQLLKYCGLDTYAMVKVWAKLHEAIGLEPDMIW